MSLRGMSQAKLGLGVLPETKITDGFYTCRIDGYSVFAMDVPIIHHVRVAVFYRVSQQFVIEEIHKFGPNVISFQLAAEEHR